MEIMVRGDDQQRKAATSASYSHGWGPSLLPRLLASTRPQRLFLHPPDRALLGPLPQGGVQPLGLAFKALMTRFQSVCQLDVLLLALLQPHQICPLSRPRLAMQVVSHTYVANLQQKPWMPRLG